MCWMVAIPMALAAASSAMSSAQEAKAGKAQNKALAAQATENIKQSNYQQADMNLNARDKLEEATSESTANNMKRVQAMGTIKAAMGEGMLGGNSMDRVLRVSEGDYIRQNAQVTDQYKRDYASIFAKKVGTAESTESNVNSLNNQHVKGKSKLEIALGMGMAAGKAWAGSSASGGMQASGSGGSGGSGGS